MRVNFEARNKIGDVFDIHAKTFDELVITTRMNACGYSLESTFTELMDVPMIYTGNPYVSSGNILLCT